MKKTNIGLAILFSTILFSSCVTSLFTVATYKNISTDKRIEGKWMARDMEFSIGRLPDWVFKKIMHSKNNPYYLEDSIYYAKSYEVDCRKGDVEYNFNMDLTRIGKNLYMDIGPAGFESPLDSMMWQKRYGGKLEYLPTFTIAKLEVSNDNLILVKFINGSYVKSLIDNDKLKIKHEEDSMYGMFLITAPSEELQQFLLKYGDDERIYSKENTIALKRIQPPSHDTP